jgi:hypothetical protein
MASGGVEVRFSAPVPEEEPIANSTGHVDLEWEMVAAGSAPAAEAPDFQLESAGEASFADALLRYSGPDTRSFVSGLPAGLHYFRVRAATPGEETDSWGAWSAPLAVEVDYVAPWKVFGLMAVGLVCLVATVLIIVRGTLRHEDQLVEKD